MSDFWKDLEYGVEKEKEIINYLADNKAVVKHVVGQGRFCDYDYVIDGISYEQKTDRIAYTTKNLCIELRNKKGENTGLLNTKSQVWVHYPVNCKQLIIIPVSELKSLAVEYILKVGKKKALKITKEGTECLLLPINEVPSKYKIEYVPCLI